MNEVISKIRISLGLLSQEPSNQALIPIEKHLEGGWIGVIANLTIFLKNYEWMMQRSLKTRLRAEYPVKGSELLPRDSSGYELEVRNAILLYEIWSTKYQIMQCLSAHKKYHK